MGWSLDQVFYCDLCKRLKKLSIEFEKENLPIETFVSKNDIRLYEGVQIPRGAFYPECYNEDKFNGNPIKARTILPVLMNPGDPLNGETYLFNEIIETINAFSIPHIPPEILEKFLVEFLEAIISQWGHH